MTTTALSKPDLGMLPSHRFADGTRLRLTWYACLGVIAALAFSVAALMSWNRSLAPHLHDEFSNLLVADTLRHGRLSNPSPEVWQPFQSFHVLVNPSYSSKYPLGPGAMLALGWMLLGTPAAGIWISAGLCAAAVTWAAAGCMPKRWAVVAGLLLALSPNVHHHWSLCLMSGWITASSSALVAGAILRLRRRLRFIDCMLLGLGVAGLALTRPFEGLLFTITSGMLLLFWWRNYSWWNMVGKSLRVALYSAGPVTAALALIAAHNQATTGNVLKMPYALHEAQYGVAPLNVFQSERIPEMVEWSADVPPTVLAFHFGWSLESYRKRNHLAGWCGAVAERFHVVSSLWGWAFCLIGTAMLIRRRGPYWPIAAAILVAMTVGTLIPWYFTHYFAPSLVWLVILTVVGMHLMLSRMASDRRTVRLAVCTLLLTQAIFLAEEIAAANLRPDSWADARQELQHRLASEGRHLILVRYHANHNVHHEWVYNGADLDQSPVVWARSWRPDLDDRLLKHYADRQVWLLELDEEDHPTLSAWQ